MYLSVQLKNLGIGIRNGLELGLGFGLGLGLGLGPIFGENSAVVSCMQHNKKVIKLYHNRHNNLLFDKLQTMILVEQIFNHFSKTQSRFLLNPKKYYDITIKIKFNLV